VYLVEARVSANSRTTGVIPGEVAGVDPLISGDHALIASDVPSSSSDDLPSTTGKDILSAPALGDGNTSVPGHYVPSAPGDGIQSVSRHIIVVFSRNVSNPRTSARNSAGVASSLLSIGSRKEVE
ncbi:MAG: hypothetical protein ABJO54_07390, partial [Hyphomicrobiales bacterium]